MSPFTIDFSKINDSNEDVKEFADLANHIKVKMIAINPESADVSDKRVKELASVFASVIAKLERLQELEINLRGMHVDRQPERHERALPQRVD